MADISVKQKEAKTVTFTITQNNDALDVSGGEFKFAVKKAKGDTTYLIEKETADFDVSEAGDGILRTILNETDLDLEAGEYIAELKIDLSTSSAVNDNIDKSADLSLEVLQAVITD